jgi:translation initiation factor IF-3
LVDEEGNQLGVVETSVGIAKALEAGLDLVEVAGETDTPVCKIMDYTKYKYEQKKKKKNQKKKQQITHLKEIRFKPNIEEHDYQVKLKRIRDFLEHKDKVKIQVRFRGRENVHKEVGMGLINKIIKDVADIGEIDSEPTRMGKSVFLTIVPKA